VLIFHAAAGDAAAAAPLPLQLEPQTATFALSPCLRPANQARL